MHLAAQPLVRKSYAEPVETMTTNVIGTMNVLEAARQAGSVKAIVVVTTDKVYANREWVWAYRETDRLGGHDPYSASKACAELVTDAWRKSFLDGQGVNVATARAGNVIGGGDWSADRLIPDCLAALARGAAIHIRNPKATRPWQHVLEPLAGYLVLAERLHNDAVQGLRPSAFAQAWNFGPEPADVQPVSWLADRMVAQWGDGARWEQSVSNGPHEAGLLAVDTAKAKAHLGWRPRLPLRDALDWTINWARRHGAGEPAGDLVLAQIATYEGLPAPVMKKAS
jgi:CDP-glucose 4,6-dehydratase